MLLRCCRVTNICLVFHLFSQRIFEFSVNRMCVQKSTFSLQQKTGFLLRQCQLWNSQRLRQLVGLCVKSSFRLLAEKRLIVWLHFSILPSFVTTNQQRKIPRPVKASKACGQLAIWGSLVQMKPPPHDLPHQSPLCGWWWVYLTQSLFSCCHNIRKHPSANAHLDLKMPSVLCQGRNPGTPPQSPPAGTTHQAELRATVKGVELQLFAEHHSGI